MGLFSFINDRIVDMRCDYYAKQIEHYLYEIKKECQKDSEQKRLLDSKMEGDINLFNNSMKKNAIEIHNDEMNRYNLSYDSMKKACEELYGIRTKSVQLIRSIENVINSIANTPKEFDTQFGIIRQAVKQFSETEEYVQKAYEASVKAGKNIVSGTAAGVGIASMTPTVLMSIATTFGTASTGTAISALSGAAAQKAAVAWLGRTFTGFAVKGTAGLAAGEAFLALAGPIGWGITATTVVVSLFDLSNQNEKIAVQALDEAQEIAKTRAILDETIKKVKTLKQEIWILLYDLSNHMAYLEKFRDMDFEKIRKNKDDILFLGDIVNNTSSLATMLNRSIE